MSLTLGELNDATVLDAGKSLRSCNASRGWVETVVAGRPYDSLEELHCEAERTWWNLSEEDWLEAFASHPRLGESPSAESVDDTADGWSRQEQSGLADSDPTAQGHLSAANAAYEERFGFVYLVDATSKSIEELLDIALRRLGATREDELRVAAGEQMKITRRRIDKLLT